MIYDSQPHRLVPIVNKPVVKFKKLEDTATIPTKAYPTDLGFDLYALTDTVLTSGKVTKVSTGIAAQFPAGYGALIRDRSSVATKLELSVVAGVIDETYTGELIVALYNKGTPTTTLQIYGKNITTDLDIRGISTESLIKGLSVKTEVTGDVVVKAGDRIAQLILIPTVQVMVQETNILGETDRGTLGFGSSGV